MNIDIKIDEDKEDVYMFRAECQPDVLIFIRCIWMGLRHCVQIMSKDDAWEPDVIFVMQKDGWTLPQMLWLLDHIQDCHILQESLQLKADYTGDRIPYRVTEKPSNEAIEQVIRLLDGFKDSVINDPRIGEAVNSLRKAL